MGNFPLHLKSTLDMLIFKLATDNGYDFFDLDGAYMDADKAESANAALVWSLLSLVENNRDPFWHIQFEVGARTSNDESQYLSLQLTSLVQELFSAGSSFFIQDFSTEVEPTEKVGEIIIISAGTAPPAFDRISGIRPIQISASVQRFT